MSVTSHTTGSPIRIYCRTGDDEWRSVVAQDEHGVTVAGTKQTFAEVWSNSAQAQPDATDTQSIPWNDLCVPLPDPNVTCWAYALTYHEHRREARLDTSFKFPKGGPALAISHPVKYRANLDYEAELGLLMRRADTNRFGYILVNDLTDRGIQVREYDEKNPVPSFSHSKTFEESLRVGPLLAVGDAAAWQALDVTLAVNGEQRQHVAARDCVYDPQRFHGEVFSDANGPEWSLVASGTGGGVIFRQPSFAGKLWLFVSSGFSVNGAKEKLLRKLDFLKPGDRITMQASTLGQSSAIVSE